MVADCLILMTQSTILIVVTLTGKIKASNYRMHIRAGEFTKKKLYHGKNRVFGPKNAPKKFGSPTPNFPPPQFGK